MTNSRSAWWVSALAALLVGTCLVTTASAQEEAPPERDNRTAILFHVGMQALAAVERADSDEARRDLYDKAIAAFRLVLVNRPELIRVRLELARTFFLKGQDGLGAAALRAGAGRRGAAAGGRQHP